MDKESPFLDCQFEDTNKIIKTIINIIISYSDNSEVQLYIFSNYDLIFSESYILKSIKDNSEFNFHLDNAITNNNIIAIILKTPRNSNFEIRSLRFYDQKIELLSSDELQENFSIDNLTGMSITPPENYIFKDIDRNP